MRGLSARREIEPRTGSGCTGQCTGLTPDLVSRQALLAINLWYGLPYATVLLVDTPLPEGQWTNTCPYEDRGWCRLEYHASAMVEHAWCLTLSKLRGFWDWRDVVDQGKGARPPPMSPAAFAAMLEEGVASGIDPLHPLRRRRARLQDLREGLLDRDGRCHPAELLDPGVG